MIVFSLILIVFSFVVDIYAYQSVRTILKDKAPALRRIFSFAFWFVSATVIALIVYSIVFRSRSANLSPLAQWSFSIFITLLITKIFVIIFLLAEDIVRFLRMLLSFVRYGRKVTAGDKVIVPQRRKFVSTAALALASLPFGSFVYGITKGKYNFKVHRQQLFFKDLPENFDGFTITQLSDFHSGSFDDIEAVAHGIELANSQKSDLIVFTGDMVNNLAEEIIPYREIFSRLNAPHGVFSILGNHDYGEYISWPSKEAKAENLQRLINLQRDMGFRLMLNENFSLEKDGQKIDLIGIENWGVGFTQRGDLEKAMRGLEKNSFKILFSHDPSHWKTEVKNHSEMIHLTLAGHTHGFQMGIETPIFRWSPVQYRYQYWAGFGEENGRKIYVNRGFGFIGFAGRVGIWPEITVIELRRIA